MSEKELPVVKVGDMLAFRYGHRLPEFQLCKVERITPTGRIVCGQYTLNPDLSIRGERPRWSTGPYRAEVITPEISEIIERKKLARRVKDQMTMELLYGLPTEKLIELNSLLAPPEGQPQAQA